MNAVVLGPLVFATDRLAAILGIAVFLTVTSILARRVDPRIGTWSIWSLAAGLVAARIGHVVIHWESFLNEPLRAAAFWQGGFNPVTGSIGVLVASICCLRSVKVIIPSLLSLALAITVWLGAFELTKATLGQVAPDFELQTLNGPLRLIDKQDGKPTVVNLWASWCPPCRREMPLLSEVAASRDDVNFLFINQGETPEAIRAYLGREHISLENILLDPMMQTSRYYQTRGLPVTLFLRADGTLATMHIGEVSRERLASGIERL